MASAEKSLAKTGSQFQSIGTKLTAGLTLPIVAVAGAAIKAAMDFETSFAGVGKTVDGVMTRSGKLTDFGKQLQGAFRDMAKQMPVSVNELNKIGEAAGALGIPKDKILEFTRVTAMLGATTNLTSDQAATAIAKIQNQYQAAGVDTDRFAATLVALGNAGASTESQIVEFAARMGGAAVQAGVSQAAVLGWSNAMASVGLNAEVGSTAWNKVISAMGVAVDMGGDKLKGFAAVAGMTAASFSQMFKGDASEAMNRVVEGFARVKENGGNLTKVMNDLGMKTSGIQMTFKNLAGANDMVRTSLDLSKQAWKDNTAAEEEYQKRAATTASQLQILYSKAYDVAITLGQTMLPAIIKLIPAVESLLGVGARMVQWFAGLPVPVQTAVFGLAAFAAALGPMAYLFGTLVSAGGGILALFSKLGITAAMAPVIASASFAFDSFSIALLGIPAVAAIGMIGGIAAAIVGLTYAVPKMTEAVKGLWAAWQLGGGKGLLGELGRNTMDDDLSFFKEGRIDQNLPGRKGKGDIHLGPTDPIEDMAAQMKASAAQQVELKKRHPELFAGVDVGKPDKLTPEQKKAKKEAEDWKKSVDKMSGQSAIDDAVEAFKQYKAAGSTSKEVTQHLTKQLDNAFEAYVRLGNAAAAAGKEVVRMPLDMLAQWAGGQKANTITPLIDHISQATLDQGALADKMKALVQSTVGRMGMPNSGNTPSLMLPDMPVIIPELSLATMTINADAIAKMKLAVSPLREAFNQLGKDVPGIIADALKNGGSIIGAIGASVGAQFSSQFQKALEKAGGDLSKVSGANKALGVAGGAISAAFTGYDLGAKLGKGKGALAGAAAGASMGSVAGPWGTAIGAGVGALAGFFGGKKKDKEAKAQMAEQRDEILKQFGGMEKLKALADSLHVSLGNAFTTTKPEEFRASIEKLNAAIEKHKIELEGLSEITSGVNARGTAFADSLKAGGAQPGSEAEFNRVGAMALGGLGASMAGGAGLLESLTLLQPVLGALNQAQAEFNFNGSETTQRLLEMNAAVQANLPTFQALSADGQILNGMIKANWADFGLFAATTSDVTAKVAELTAGGMSLNQALGLNQPVLQALWQAQQQFGFATDEATQALLDQAIANGIVGPQMKSTQDQMLDVLKAIAQVLGADIPAAMAGLPGAAKAAADGMNDAFSRVKPPMTDLTGADYGTPNPPSGDYTGPTGDLNDLFPGRVVHPGGNDVYHPDIPALAGGGLVMGKTLAWIGEAGPELVLPVDGVSSLVGQSVAPLTGAISAIGGAMGSALVGGFASSVASSIGGAFGGLFGAGGGSRSSGTGDNASADPLPDGWERIFGKTGANDAQPSLPEGWSRIVGGTGTASPDLSRVSTPASVNPYANDTAYAGKWRDRMRSASDGQPITLEMDGETVGRILLPRIADESNRMRLNG